MLIIKVVSCLFNILNKLFFLKCNTKLWGYQNEFHLNNNILLATCPGHLVPDNAIYSQIKVDVNIIHIKDMYLLKV